MDLYDVVEAPIATGVDTLSRYTSRIFTPLPRADQRRWAEIYLRGLLLGEGRKSVRRIAHGLEAPYAVQSLQQFVNQSPWKWMPVRARIAQYVLEQMRPEAWLLCGVHIPKRGDASVGVARRFVPALGRTVSCQLAYGSFLASATGSLAADWRIVLPRSCDAYCRHEQDAASLHTPAWREDWEHIISLVDQMLDWQMPVAPVVLDMRTVGGVTPLVDALHQRRLDYIIRVSPGLQVGVSGWAGRGGASPTSLRSWEQGTHTRQREVVAWVDPASDRLRHSQFISTTVLLPPDGAEPGRPGSAAVSTGLVGLWAPAVPDATSFWLISPRQRDLAAVLPLAWLARTGATAHASLARYGFFDFEGRSYRGWHHHATLVTAASAFAQLHHRAQRLAESAIAS